MDLLLFLNKTVSWFIANDYQPLIGGEGLKNKTSIWRKCIIFATIILGVSLFNQSGGASDVPKGLAKSGDIVPAFSVPVPKNKAYRSYLELKKSGSFEPAKMEMEFLFIYVLNVY